MRRNVKMCIDRMVPGHLLAEAMRRAIEENPANVPIFRDLPGLGVEPSPLRMALLTGKKWQNGRELKVHFWTVCNRLSDLQGSHDGRIRGGLEHRDVTDG